MLPEHRVLLEDEPCPVADQMLRIAWALLAKGGKD